MDYWIHITAGKGPDECARAAFLATKQLAREAEQQGLTLTLLNSVAGNKADTITSALLSVSGDTASRFIAAWGGSIQWIAQSPFRPAHKRKNWFIGISVYSPPADNLLSMQDFKIETMKASGPGGQHVNKSQTAVRITHIPTGLVAVAQEERSQFMNKKLAMARVSALLEQQKQKLHAAGKKQQWEQHNSLERGNPTRIFIGSRFKEK